MKGRVFGLGSVAASLGMALCCLAPILFPILGLSTFASLWLLSVVVPYRPYFIAATVVFLGLGFYTVYRRSHRRFLDVALLWVCSGVVAALVVYTLRTEGLRSLWPF